MPGFEPALAAELPTANEDATVWTVRLRPDVTFSDSSTFGAEDVVATYEAILDPASASEARSSFDMIEKVVATDDDTIEFHLAYSYAPLLTKLLIGVVPSESVATPGLAAESSLNTEPIGTGPYTLVDLSPDRAVFEANEDYWDGAPEVERLTLLYVPDDNTRAQRMASGEIDGTNLPPLLANTFEDKDGMTVTAHTSADWRGLSLPMDNPVSGDPAVRMALNLAANRQSMIDNVLGGHGRAAATPIPEVYGDAYEPRAVYAYDRTRPGRSSRTPDGSRVRTGSASGRPARADRAHVQLGRHGPPRPRPGIRVRRARGGRRGEPRGAVLGPDRPAHQRRLHAPGRRRRAVRPGHAGVRRAQLGVRPARCRQHLRQPERLPGRDGRRRARGRAAQPRPGRARRCLPRGPGRVHRRPGLRVPRVPRPHVRLEGLGLDHVRPGPRTARARRDVGSVVVAAVLDAGAMTTVQAGREERRRMERAGSGGHARRRPRPHTTTHPRCETCAADATATSGPWWGAACSSSCRSLRPSPRGSSRRPSTRRSTPGRIPRHPVHDHERRRQGDHLGAARVRPPLVLDVLGWVQDLFGGDLGLSRSFNQPVAQVIAERLPWTLLLAGTALALAVVIALLLGITAGAQRRDPGPWGHGAVRRGAGLPPFVMSLVAIAVFALALGWLPAAGSRTGSGPHGRGVLRHLVLPVVVLAIAQVPWLLLAVRESVVTSKGEDFVAGPCRAASPRRRSRVATSSRPRSRRSSTSSGCGCRSWSWGSAGRGGLQLAGSGRGDRDLGPRPRHGAPGVPDDRDDGRGHGRIAPRGRGRGSDGPRVSTDG
ncbi:ABC transporter substrate-binding protein [Oerskovia sp. M15]